MRIRRLLLSFLLSIIGLEAALYLGDPLIEKFFISIHNPLHTSYSLNHRPIPGSEKALLPDGTFVTYTYDQNGIRKYSQNRNSQRLAKFKILFLGDSFIQGGQEQDSIPFQLETILESTYPKVDVQIFNAGYSSYSVSLYTVQANTLIPLLQPDFIIVDIDETDFSDENYRYAAVRQVNDQGRTVAVAPDVQTLELERAMDQVRALPTRLHKVIGAFRVKFYTLPRLRKRHTRPRPRAYLQKTDSDIYRRLEREILYFKRQVTELGEVLIERLGDRRKILFAHHPHLNHLTPDPTGKLWPALVSETVRGAASSLHIEYFDATPDMRECCEHSAKQLYIAGDMHFNAEGMRTYSSFLAKHLLLQLNLKR